jgi:hypothetical protein
MRLSLYYFVREHNFLNSGRLTEESVLSLLTNESSEEICYFIVLSLIDCDFLLDYCEDCNNSTTVLKSVGFNAFVSV